MAKANPKRRMDAGLKRRLRKKWKVRDFEVVDLGEQTRTEVDPISLRLITVVATLDRVRVQSPNGEWREGYVLVDAKVAQLSGNASIHRAAQVREMLESLASRPTATAAAARRN